MFGRADGPSSATVIEYGQGLTSKENKSRKVECDVMTERSWEAFRVFLFQSNDLW